MTNSKSLILLVLALFIVQSGCKKDEPGSNDPNENISVLTTDVQTYELVSMIVRNTTLQANYMGSFGSESVELARTSDSTLVFMIPNVSPGMHELDFELTNVDFNVTETVVSNPSQIISDVFGQFDADIAILSNDTAISQTDITTSNEFKDNVMQFYNSLTEEQKIQTALIYEANKEVFQTFRSNVYQNFDAPTVKTRQSQCPTTSDKEFYFCTCRNIANSAGEFKNALVSNLEMLALAGAGGVLVLNPATSLVGVGVGGFGLAAAAYIFMTEVRPAWVKLKGDIGPFLYAQWILAENIFVIVQHEFISDTQTDLELEPELRTITAEDTDLSPETSDLISSMFSLSAIWNKVQAVFGNLPQYNNTSSDISLSEDEITISNISNPDVQLVSQSGETAKFKSLSGEDENFSYNITVNREGFSQAESISAIVIAENIDSTEIYMASAVGNYTVFGYQGNGPDSELYCELTADGNAIYTIYNDPSWADGHTFWSTWIVHKVNDEYFITTSFTNPSHILSEALKLDYPVNSFFYRNNYVK